MKILSKSNYFQGRAGSGEAGDRKIINYYYCYYCYSYYY